MAYDKIEWQTYRGTSAGHFDGEAIEMAQLTPDNYGDIRKWLEARGSEVHYWTNESFIVGLWVFDTWHDGSAKTPMPFGWWIYQSPSDGKVGIASEPALKKHYVPA